MEAERIAVRRAIEKQYAKSEANPDGLAPMALEPKPVPFIGRFSFLTERAALKHQNAVRYRGVA